MWVEATFLCTILCMNFRQFGRPVTLYMFCLAVNNGELSNHTFLLRAVHAPLDSHLARLQTLVMWLQRYTVHCCLHMETSLVQGLTKLITEFEFNGCSMNRLENVVHTVDNFCAGNRVYVCICI